MSHVQALRHGTLEGKIALVTGAGSGIGRSHALYLPTLGATVIVHDVDAQRVREVTDAVTEAGGRAQGVVCDVLEPGQFRLAIEAAAADVGPIDILVNNVGIAADCPVEDVSAGGFDTAFRINVHSFIVALQAVLPSMKARRTGRIVNTSSNWALSGQENSCLYAATKAAILGLTKSWARELAPWRITVNCIAPGGVRTALLQDSPERLAGIPLGRYAEPIDISQAVAFLASEQASYMTGCVLNLTGGELITGC